MLKKSLFIGTFFLLFIGLSDYGYGCHKSDKVGPIQHGSKPCNGGGPGPGGGDKVVGKYIVTIYNEVTNGPWLGHANESRISFNNLPNFIDVSFFAPMFTKNVECFESLDPSPVFSGGLQRKPGPTAYGQFWFPGCTRAGLAFESDECEQEVLYQLQIFGIFEDNSVIPLDPGEMAVMKMKDWILQISPGGLNIQMESCLAESKDVEDVPDTVFHQFGLEEVVIRVERCPDTGCPSP